MIEKLIRLIIFVGRNELLESNSRQNEVNGTVAKSLLKNG